MDDLDAPVMVPTNVAAIVRKHMPLVAQATTKAEHLAALDAAWSELGFSKAEILALMEALADA